jgi:hypothetical protein
LGALYPPRRCTLRNWRHLSRFTSTWTKCLEPNRENRRTFHSLGCPFKSLLVDGFAIRTGRTMPGTLASNFIRLITMPGCRRHVSPVSHRIVLRCEHEPDDHRFGLQIVVAIVVVRYSIVRASAKSEPRQISVGCGLGGRVSPSVARPVGSCAIADAAGGPSPFMSSTNVASAVAA